MKVILPKLKNQLLAMLMLLFVVQANAQTSRKADVIRLRDESKLEVYIQEVDDQVVKYKKISVLPNCTPSGHTRRASRMNGLSTPSLVNTSIPCSVRLVK